MTRTKTIARMRWGFIAFVIALATLCAVAANAQTYPPQTPFVSSLGGRSSAGGGGGGGGTITGGGASPQVAFWSGASSITGDAGFLYDAGTDTITLIGNYLGGDESAATPTYSWGSAGNTDNGMYLVAGDTIGFATGGVERARGSTTGWVFNDAGNNYDLRAEGDTDTSLFIVDASADMVGIGKSPVVKLDIETSVNTFGLFRTRNTSAGAAAAAALDSQNNGSVFGRVFTASSGNTNTMFGLSQANSVGFTSQAATRTVLASQTTGGVEIGVNSDFNSFRHIVLVNNGGANNPGPMVINEDGHAGLDFRAETDTNINGIFLDASAETIDFVGGSGSTGCSISAAGNLTCSGAISGSGTLGGSGANTQVTFFTAASTVAGDAGMTYDSAANILTVPSINSPSDLVFYSGLNNTLTVKSSGHLTSAGSVPSSVTSGTCTNESASASATDVRGTVQADCTIGQTTLVTFGTAYATAPYCVVSPANANAYGVQYAAVASTTAITISVNSAITNGQLSWICIE